MRVNNSPSFGARIVINKRNFQQLSEGAKEIGHLSSQTTALPSASAMDTALFPFDAGRDLGMGHRASNLFGNIDKRSADLFDRTVLKNIKKYTPEDIRQASTGFATVSSGLGSYAVPVSNAAGASIISNEPAIGSAVSTVGSISNIIGTAVLKDNPIGAKFIKKIPD